MQIAIDGACKRNGEPTCVSMGVAWIQTEQGDFLFKSKFEHQSTSQRGELNGLTEALEYAVANAEEDEDIIIITDSEYMYNTVALGWSLKWERQAWVGATGEVKNVDMWKHVNELLHKLDGRVFMQWTKGHLISYTPGNIKKAMMYDETGVELMTRIVAMASRPYDKQRIINDFNRHRKDHGHLSPPDDIAFDWAVANTVADSLASYLVKTLDDLLI